MATYADRVIRRDENLHMADIGLTEHVPINNGITDYTQGLNPATSSTHYIGEQNPRDKMTGYAPAISYTAEFNPSDQFNMWLYEIGKDQKIGQTFDDYEIEAWNPVDATAGTYVARKYTYEVQPAKPGSGAGGELVGLDGSLKQIGVVIKGTYNISDSAFTADAVQEPVA